MWKNCRHTFKSWWLKSNIIFLFTKWLELPLPTRITIARKFGIPKVRATHVADNRIVDDGYNITDVENALSFTVLQEVLRLDADTTPDQIWDLMIAYALAPELTQASKSPDESNGHSEEILEPTDDVLDEVEIEAEKKIKKTKTIKHDKDKDGVTPRVKKEKGSRKKA